MVIVLELHSDGLSLNPAGVESFFCKGFENNENKLKGRGWLILKSTSILVPVILKLYTYLDFFVKKSEGIFRSRLCRCLNKCHNDSFFEFQVWKKDKIDALVRVTSFPEVATYSR